MLKYKKAFILLFVILILPVSCSGCSKSTLQGGRLAEKSPKEDDRMELLEKITVDLPEEIRSGIVSDSDGFMLQVSDVLNQPSNLFLLADKQHFLGADYKPEDIVMLTDYPSLALSRNNLSLRKIVIPNLLRMVEDAREEGITLLISSTFRGYSYQKKLFDREVQQYGLRTAERESARPGTSQHQLGTAIDFGTISDDYAFTPPGRWLTNNAWKYGFSLSYPEGYEHVTGYRYECWHFRYIGPEAAKLQKDYFNDIQYYLLIFLDKHREELQELL